MTDNRQNRSNAASVPINGQVDRVEEGIAGMKIENGNENCEKKYDTDSPPLYPDRPGEPDCIYYMRTGLCGYGSMCRFNHPARLVKSVQDKGELPQRDDQPECGTGTCKYGSSCRFNHPNDKDRRPAPLNVKGLPIRQDAKSCPYYMRTYSCKFGVACKFNHPQPTASSNTVWPLSGASATGSVGASVFPSMGMPYASGVSTWVLPRPPYLSSPRVPALQTYGSIAIPPSQNIMATPGWNMYMGTVPPNIYGTNFYNTKDQGGLITAQFPSSPAKNSSLPERPDQPVCRHFMSTGYCKYASDCKYHHPQEKVAQLATHTFGPHGLPLKPGQPICSYFNTYGVCKYGPSCRFDHPITSHLESYGYSLPHLPSPPISTQPLTSYQRNSIISFQTINQESPTGYRNIDLCKWTNDTQM
ncbi:hypothetical protein V2J09_020825 [Rumex salicifolius]